MHTVAVLAVDGVVAFDLATPLEVFGRTVDADGAALYEVIVAGPERQVDAGPMTIGVSHGLDRLIAADTVVVPGRVEGRLPLAPAVIEALLDAARRGGGSRPSARTPSTSRPPDCWRVSKR